MPALLQRATAWLMLALLSSTELAAVVIHTPLMALGSQTGVGKGAGDGVGLGTVCGVPLFFSQPRPLTNKAAKPAATLNLFTTAQSFA